MLSFSSFLECKLEFKSIALGKFDGCHRAHLKLVQLLGTQGCACCIHMSNPPYLTPPRMREKLLKVPVCLLPFKEIRRLDSTQFLRMILKTMPKLEKIVVGYDFCLGYNKMHSAIDLPFLLEKINKKIDVIILEKQEINHIPIHSSIIKELIIYGDIEIANDMLGRFFSIEGSVKKGQGLGKTMLYPTINLESKDFVLPKSGVYITKTIVNEKEYRSISFLGHRISTDGNFCIETHILEDFNEVVESSILEIKFIQRLRDNKKFDNLEKLKKQIDEDTSNAKKFFIDFKEK